jgi:hypothetical protein
MIITLYKNSQHEADSPDQVYKDKWAVSPYEAASMFCDGETTEQKDFILPPGVTFSKAEGFKHLQKAPCILSTNDKGQPVLTVSYMQPFVLLTREENDALKQSEKETKKPWVPGYDKNGELEIF